MKMKMTKTKEVELSFCDDTPLFFDKDGIKPMLYVDGRFFKYDEEQLVIPWSKLFKCATCSCACHVDEANETIIQLRALADRLEKWQIKPED
jgi:hypothetical protein